MVGSVNKSKVSDCFDPSGEGGEGPTAATLLLRWYVTVGKCDLEQLNSPHQPCIHVRKGRQFSFGGGVYRDTLRGFLIQSVHLRGGASWPECVDDSAAWTIPPKPKAKAASSSILYDLPCELCDYVGLFF